MKRSISITAAVALALPMLFVGVPSATADDASSSANYTVSARSFPKVNTAKTDFFAESTSTDVDEDSNWGGLGTMNVPQTKSQAEKDAEQKAKEEEQARQQAEEAARIQREQEAAAAASRDQAREPVEQEQTTTQETTQETESQAASTQSLPSVPASKNGAAIAAFALKFQGYPYVFGGNTPSGWDCSGFVQWVYGQFGVSLPRTSGAQATVGVAVPSLAQAQPGDILADGIHAAIYIGNGLVMNAMTPELGTATESTAVFGGRPFSIRRVL